MQLKKVKRGIYVKESHEFMYKDRSNCSHQKAINAILFILFFTLQKTSILSMGLAKRFLENSIDLHKKNSIDSFS